jgi:Gas vesicle protein G
VGLISGVLLLPLAPLRGTVWLAEQLAAEAERELYDPDVIRRQIEAVAMALDAGEIDEEEAAAAEEALLERLMAARRRERQEG